MPLQAFIDEPTKQGIVHPSYANSLFTTEAPEWSTGEVLLGSVYRKLILGVHDNIVNLEHIPTLAGKLAPEQELWSSLLLDRGGLASPLKSGQRGTRPFRQLMPFVPHVARHACVVGSASKRRWNPGNFLLNVIGAGAAPAKSQQILNSLADALKVGDTDDVFARFAEQRLSTAIPEPAAAPVTIDQDRQCAFRGKDIPLIEVNPAERFCRDLESVLDLKDKLTRRQWTVLVEALLRIGMGTHMLWACHVNAKCWELALSAAGGQPIPSAAEVEAVLWQSHRDTNSFLEVGRDAVPLIKQALERHLYGRFGLNLILHKLQDAGNPWPPGRVIGYAAASGKSAPEAVQEFLQHVAANRTSIDADPANWLRSQCRDLCDKHLQLVKTDVGFTNNMLEFIRHSLGQIDTHVPEQKSYDQSYLLANRRKPRSRVNPWPVQPGPAMLILLVYACHRAQGEIPASLDDLRIHLADYGLRAPAGELAGGQVGTDLEKLGLVVDSPDAAGGRLLVAPF
jgi:hypothetical protein